MMNPFRGDCHSNRETGRDPVLRAGMRRNREAALLAARPGV